LSFRKLLRVRTILKHGVPKANVTIGGILMADLVNQEARECIERFDPLGINLNEFYSSL
jgi:hypothetical protein